MKKLTYKESIKKQTGTLIAGFFSVLGILWLFQPIDTPIKYIVVSSTIAIIAFLLIIHIRKNAYKQPCEKCQNDIFPFIEFGKSVKQNVKFCPLCGEKVEI